MVAGARFSSLGTFFPHGSVEIHSSCLRHGCDRNRCTCESYNRFPAFPGGRVAGRYCRQPMGRRQEAAARSMLGRESCLVPEQALLPGRPCLIQLI